MCFFRAYFFRPENLENDVLRKRLDASLCINRHKWSNNSVPSNPTSRDKDQNSAGHDIQLNNYMESTGPPDFVNLEAKNLIKITNSYKTKQRLTSSMIKCGYNEDSYMKYFKEKTNRK